MPVSGGAADKLGNRYETSWAIDQLLRIVDGSAHHLILEPLDQDEARGVEFVVYTDGNTKEYWSVKSQTTKAEGWTLSILTSQDKSGRTILGDLLRHVEMEPSSYAVFASAQGARDLEELRTFSIDKVDLDARLSRSAKLNAAFRKYILPLCSNDPERALTFLRRTRISVSNEVQLRGRFDFATRKLFYSVDGSLKVAEIRGHLSELLLDNIHKPLDKVTILGKLAKHGIRLREWSADKSVLDRIEDMCESYTLSQRSRLINGSLLPLPGAESLLSFDGHLSNAKSLVVGGAGAGKSTTLAAVVEHLRALHVPVIPIRFDQLPEGILTTTELGRKLLLPDSPVLTLAGVASGAPSVLVIDQLDAISIASGRRADLWFLFDDLWREIDRSPRMSLIVGCREFDLEHDHRIRTMKADQSGFAVVTVKPLTIEQVDGALLGASMKPSSVDPSLKTILTNPLHLSMFLDLAPSDRECILSKDDLFDKFWVESERRVDQRLGRKAAWTQVIDKIADWLSENQQLSAPEYILDDLSSDARAMLSERILNLTDHKYQFFHESFFDYAFARRWVARGDDLLCLLFGAEQHLFRRGQVRQVLSYLRAHEWRRYLDELERVIAHSGVRFHIKRLVFDWLSSLVDPRQEEWLVLQKVLRSNGELSPHIRGITAGRPSWFDVLDSEELFDTALSAESAQRQEEVVWMLSSSELLKERSGRIAALLRLYRKPGNPWNQYLRFVCRNGQVFYSREMFEFFLALINDGTLDDLRPGFAVNDDWWSVLYSVAHEQPELACQVIGHWFDRTIIRWKSEDGLGGARPSIDQLSRRLNTGSGGNIIQSAAQSTLSYVEQVLPRVASFIEETAIAVDDDLDFDPLWSRRHFGGSVIQNSAALLSCLARALATLAKAAPADLDRLLAPYLNRGRNTITYLVLRAWTAAPESYADRLAEFLAADPRRLKIGYSSWSGSGGSPAIHTSASAVRAASATCTTAQFEALEHAIISLQDKFEAKYPKMRGLMQLELLRSLDFSRLGSVGKARLAELQRKFPLARHDPPTSSRVSIGIPSPISADGASKMLDAHWVRAMNKYARRNRLTPEYFRSGGEPQLAQLLTAQTKLNPERFLKLAEQIPSDFPASYFSAILRGVAESVAYDNRSSAAPVSQARIVSLVRRVHGLPGRPCGNEIAWLIKKWKDYLWPEEVVDVLAWYALNDPDPDTETWRTLAPSGQPYHGGCPHSAGINSIRGTVADSIALLISKQPERLERLLEAVRSLSIDSSIAVRSCAVETLLAMLDLDAARAICWFCECVSVDSVMLGTPYVESFIHCAGYRDFGAVYPVIEAMLKSPSPEVMAAAARQVTLLSLDVESAKPDAERVRNGNPIMRAAAAEVYSSNIAHDIVGPTCLQLLKPFFADPDDSVRAKAASAFEHLAGLSSRDQAELLSAFLGTSPGRTALELVVRALESSSVQLPDLVCSCVERCIDANRDVAGDISSAGAAVAMELSKIVVRLYAQTEDRTIKSRCLDLIDEMERHHFLGLSEELRRLDR
jgi:hypothetical protein